MKVETIYPNKWTYGLSWSQDDFHNEPLVNVFEFSGISSWLQLCPSRNRHSSVETLHWFIFARTALSGFQLMLLFSWDAFFFIFIFFSFFYCFTTRLRTWTLFKMNEFFFLRKKLFSSSTYIWSKWNFKVRNVAQVRVYTRRG